jgi:hypothetical protein
MWVRNPPTPIKLHFRSGCIGGDDLDAAFFAMRPSLDER